jgi:hypothetical protein
LRSAEPDATSHHPIVPHPLYAELIPPMSDEERRELEASIKEEGLLDDIVINAKNQIIDGYSRQHEHGAGAAHAVLGAAGPERQRDPIPAVAIRRPDDLQWLLGAVRDRDRREPPVCHDLRHGTHQRALARKHAWHRALDRCCRHDRRKRRA